VARPGRDQLLPLHKLVVQIYEMSGSIWASPLRYQEFGSRNKRVQGDGGQTYKLAGRRIEPLFQLALLCLLEFEQQRSDTALRYIRQVRLELLAISEARILGPFYIPMIARLAVARISRRDI
jgi:hypothetical protein